MGIADLAARLAMPRRTTDAARGVAALRARQLDASGGATR
jgi:hypothetical protein